MMATPMTKSAQRLMATEEKVDTPEEIRMAVASTLVVAVASILVVVAVLTRVEIPMIALVGMVEYR